MLTVLWVCNTPLPEIQNVVGVRNYNEGWLVGISGQLKKREDIVFHYAFPQKKYKRLLNKTIDGITFWGFYDYHKNLYKLEKESELELNTIIRNVNPDIIHIFGTEYPHALECIRCVPDKKKVVVSLQGLVSELARVYSEGIPFTECLKGRFDSRGYHCILTEKLDFCQRGRNEKEALQRVGNVIGRTAWDKKNVRKRNAACRYFHCNETLRDDFYEGSWTLNNVKRHSIFVSQGGYPIKGLHILIAALPFIKKIYPDVMVSVAGDKDFLDVGTPYGRFISKLLKKYHAEKNIIFLGYLTAEKMKHKLIESHVMVMPSLLENSPNAIGEAMLLGTPVVAANVGGIPSILKNEREGYLYQSLDEKDLAKKVCSIFLHDDLALQFSKCGQRRAAKVYNKSDNVQQLMKIYQEINTGEFCRQLG